MGTIHKFERSKPAKASKPGPWDQPSAKPGRPAKGPMPRIPMFKSPAPRRGGREPIINSWRGLLICLALMVGLSLVTGIAGNIVAQVLALLHIR